MNSEQDQLFGALAAAQAQMQNAALNKVNPHFRNKYADLAAIREAITPSLSANGLAVVQFTSIDPDARFMLLHTRLAHKSGQSIESVYPVPFALDKPQAMGSALTYARRYSLSAICGIAAEEDDDANAAQSAVKPNGVTTAVLGQKPMSKAKSRDLFKELVEEMRAIKVPGALTKWALENSNRIHSMDGEFQEMFREENYKPHLEFLKAQSDEGPLKQQLRASLEAEDA